MKKETKPKAKMGRPPLEFDQKQIEIFGYFRATYETMADFLNCSYDTIRRNMQDEDSDFCKSYKKATASRKIKLSEAQMKYALNGNASLLIWLGKQDLGQTDNPILADSSSDYFNLIPYYNNLLSHQLDYAMSKGRFTGLIAGYGSGKTFAEIARYINMASIRQGNCKMFIGAPTYRLLKDNNIPKFIAEFDNLGIKYNYLKSDQIIEVLTPQVKGEIMFRTMDNPEKIVAYDVTDAQLDEFDTLPLEKQRAVYEKIIARMRGCSDATLGITTTPEGYKYTHKLFEDDKIGKLIVAKTGDNTYLSKEYEAMLRDQYDTQRQAQYIDGKFVDLNNDKAYYSFNRILHTYEKDRPLPKQIYIGIDFNVNPMTATISEYDGNILWTFDEFWIENAGTQEMCNVIKARYPFEQFSEVYCYPDMTGDSRHTSATTTDIKILVKEGFKIIGTHNLKQTERVKIVNNTLDKQKAAIHTRCKHLITDLVQVGWTDNNLLDKSNPKLTHTSDGYGYVITRIFEYNSSNNEHAQIESAV